LRRTNGYIATKLGGVGCGREKVALGERVQEDRSLYPREGVPMVFRAFAALAVVSLLMFSGSVAGATGTVVLLNVTGGIGYFNLTKTPQTIPTTPPAKLARGGLFITLHTDDGTSMTIRGTLDAGAAALTAN
jgi:hypothetical protein